MAEIINGVPIGDLPGIGSVPDDSMLVVEFLGKAYHMPGAVLRQMIQDVLDSMGDSVDDVTEARLTAAIETVLASGKYNGVSPSVEVLDEEDGTTVIHIIDAFGDKRYPVEVKGARNAVQYVEQELTDEQKAQARKNIGVGDGTGTADAVQYVPQTLTTDQQTQARNNIGIPEFTSGLMVIVNPNYDLTSQHVMMDWGHVFADGTRFDNRFEFDVPYSAYELARRNGYTKDELTFYKEMSSNLGNPKADSLQIDSDTGTLMLLSAGEPIGEAVTLPAGSATDSKIFIADLNTSTYEDIKAADDAGKICYALWGGYTACMLTTLSPESAIFTTLLDPHLGLYVKFTKGTVGVSDFGLTESHSVLYEPQSLTDAQKAQARENIGALSADDIDVDSIGSNVFVADYDTTTFAEIKAAHDAGKVCFLDFKGIPFLLLGVDDTEALFVREMNENQDYEVTITADGGKSFKILDKNISDVYVAGLFSAKYAEVKAAYEAGKACFVTYGALLCPLTVLDAEKAEFVGMLTPHIGMKGILYADGTYNFTYVHSNAVQTVEQSLTEEKKAQARANIGALSTADVDTVLQQAKDSGQFDGKDGEDGYTPVKGVDYFDGKDGYTPVKGKDYFDGYTPVKGKDYFDGANGKTAYAYAQDGGYTGTEAEFAAKLASGSEPLVVTLSGNDTDGYTADKTVAEIHAARNAGRDVYMVGGSVTYQLSYLNGSFAAFSYTMASRNAIEIISVIMMSGVAPTRIHQTIDDSYVKYTAQSLDEDYKLQARSNIGALGTGGGTLSGGLDFSNNNSWITPYLLAFKNDDPNANPTYPYTGFYQWGDEWQVNARDAANNWVKNLLSINNITGIATFAAVPTVNGAQLALKSDISGGNANTSTMPLGFASRVTGAEWGNTIGTSFTSWNDPTGGSIDFRQDNPSSGKMSIKVDGRVYVNEGLNPVMGTEHANGYWGMTSPDGENNAWIRTTTSGIIPYQEGGAGSGHCYLGTSSWYFGESYIDRMYSTNLTLAGRAYMNEWIQCNSEGGLFFPNYNGLHIMANNVSTYTPLRIVGERTTYNGVLFGNDSTGLNVMSNAEHQGLYNESLSRWITYYHRPTDKIGIGTAGLSGSTITLGGSTNVQGILTQGSPSEDASVALMNRFQSDLFVQGSGAAPNGPTVAGFYLGKSTSDENRHMDIVSGGDYSYIDFNKAGRAADYDARLLVNVTNGYTEFMWGNSGEITQRVLNIQGSLRKYGAEVATLADVVSASGGALKVTLSGNDTDGYTVDKTFAEIKTAWEAGRYVYVTNGVIVCNLCYFSTSIAAVFTYTRATGDGVEVWSVMVNNLGTKPTVVKKTITA